MQTPKETFMPEDKICVANEVVLLCSACGQEFHLAARRPVRSGLHLSSPLFLSVPTENMHRDCKAFWGKHSFWISSFMTVGPRKENQQVKSI